MDGRVLLLACVGILAGAYFLGDGGSGTIALDFGRGRPAAFGAGGTAAGDAAADARHEEIRQSLRREGYDLGDPASFVRERDGRTVVGGPVAATEHLRPAFIEAIVEGYHRPAPSELPGRVSAAAPVADCRVSPPERGARVANVFSNATPQAASFYAFDPEELEPLARDLLAAKAETDAPGGGLAKLDALLGRQQAAASGEGGAEPFRYSVMEVAVTETETPVHLVLQTGQGRVLWNLHLAEGAEVSGVSLLGGRLPAVANLPRRVPVEAMDAAAMAACGLTPVRLPLASDPIFADVERGALPVERAREGLEAMRTEAEAWNGWFAGTFGPRSDETRIGYDEAAIMAVVGPLPEDATPRVSFRSLAGAPVVLPAAGETFAKDPVAAETRVNRMARDLAGKLAEAGEVTQ